MKMTDEMLDEARLESARRAAAEMRGMKTHVVIFDECYQPIWDSRNPNGVALADVITVEPHPCTVEFRNGFRWSGIVRRRGDGFEYESDLDLIEKMTAWPDPFGDVSQTMTAIREGYKAIGEAAESVWNAMQPIVKAVHAEKRKRPPFWAVDVNRGHRPKRIGNQPARQGRR
ncbi:hypothetical protein ACKAMS_24750 [Rhodococcus sp. 5A-K4]|uniref:hypothetical protein n=1 Tax=Rhodococcus sp. 5A-K4 TaxID=3384442 RepID=UPI0038D4E484